ncbi:MAG: Hsp70 family protein, partial [Deltaproteobacteria bacterium]|nr:Hsp70 family protein [Deltaproteobacteria bacterium]
TRDHYGLQFADILLELNSALGDIRLVEILKPYSHVWIRPPKFRETIREIIAELTKLRETYTGFETEKPEFTGETHPEPKSLNTEKSKASVTPLNDLTETIAVDLGATNTVVMQRLAGKDAEPLDLATASINIDGLRVIPTLLDASEEKIGKEVDPSKGVENIKGLALENDQAGRDSIKEFITLLSTRITSARGGEEKGKDSWLTRRFSSTSKDTPRLVLTVPVGFDDYRSLIKESFTLSSPEAEVELIEEPLAAAIGYQVATKEDKLVLVLDFGGCTLDVMLLRLKDNELHVVAKPDQSNRLGGRDIDLWLAKYLAKKARGEADEGSKELILIAEEIKKTLSTHEAAPFLWKGQKIEDITRFDFEDVLEENGFYKSVDRTVGYVLGKAKKLGITPEMIEAVVLTGGSSLIPSFKDKLGDLFPELLARNEIYDHSPFSAVAGGASVYGTSLVTDRHLGVACALRYTARNAGAPFSYEIVLEKGDHLPIKKSYLLRPAKTLGTQDELSIELFEIPESFVTRRWVLESGMEFIKQILKPLKDRPDFRAFKSTRIKINDKDLDDDGRFPITFSVDLSGKLKLVCGEDNTEIETGLHLQ